MSKQARDLSGWLVWLAVGVALAYVVWTAGVVAALPPLPGRAQGDATTGLVSLVAGFVARLSGAVVVGALAGLLLFTEGTFDDRARRLSAWAGRSAQLWAVASLLMTVAYAAFVNGVPMALVLRPDAWFVFQLATPASLSWLVTALVAAGSAVASYRLRTLAGAAVSALAAMLAWLFVAVTGNVSVGRDHDWATDASAVATVGLVTLLAIAFGAWRLLPTVPDPAAGMRRYRRLVPPALAAAVVGTLVVDWQQLAGKAVTATPAGVAIVGSFACAAAWLVSWALRRGSASPASLGRDVVIGVLWVGFLVAADHVPTPRFSIPQSTQVNYLGYEMPIPATIARLAGLGRPNLLWVVLTIAALALYAWGIVRLRRAGETWQVGRTIAWTLGWMLTLYLAVSGLWEYSTAVFSWHMLVHMTMNMLVPILCVMGAPVELFARASRTTAGLTSASTVLDSLSQNRLVRALLSPPVLWVNYVTSLFAVYFTPLFPWLMRYHWAHQLMLLHFMVAGLLFFNLVVGPGRQLWQLPYLVKFALMVSVMPFHALFAVGIMMSTGLIGGDFYHALDVTWVGDLLADQNIAGQITWFTGEIPMFVAVIALAFQWWGDDSREAKRKDEAIDAGEDDDPLAEYNSMLERMAQEDRRLAAEARIDELKGRS